MSNNLNLSDSINFAIASGKTPTFIYNGTTYSFSPAGLLAFFTAEYDAEGTLSYTIPTVDPAVAGVIWNDEGVLKSSAGE